MRFVTSFLALIAAATLAGASVAAPMATFSGTGTVDSVGGRLTPTGVAPVGSALDFRFSFDPAAARLYSSEEGYAVYDLPGASFTATLGGYALPVATDPALVPFVELYDGFSFFGGTSSEPSVAFTFYLIGPFNGATTTGTPFVAGPGSNNQLALSGVFRADPTNPALTVAGLLGRGAPVYQDFQYGTRDPASKQSGVLNGTYAGRFAVAAPVPETGTWAMLVVGLGAVGTALRRRPRRLAAA